MRSIFILALLYLFQIQIISGQEISAKVVDSKTKEPIPYATIQYAPFKGVITNDEGRFNIQAVLAASDVITISSLGYETVQIPAENLKQPVIFLKPQSIALGDVFVTNKNLTGKEIIERVKKNVPANYTSDISKKKFFFRESNINTVRQFDLKIDKSTIPEINQNLLDRIAYNVPKMNDSYKEVLGDFYGNYDANKIQVIKAANLHNPNSKVDLELLTKKLENIFQKNVKSNSVLKIKSGIIGFKVDAKEFTEELKDEEKIAKIKTPEELEKERVQRHKNLSSSTNLRIQELLGTMFWKEKNTFNVFEKSGKYKFNVEGIVEIDNATAYMISFEPKRGADFKGKIYVNTLDYGVYRIDYHNVKPTSKFRLLGISVMDDIYRGKMIFSKDAAGKYQPKYIENEKGEAIGIDRPLTIIEKNKFVSGRNKQNELDLDFKLKVGDLVKYQLVVYESQPVEEGVYQNLKSSPEFDYKTFKVYNPEFWNGYNIIEPNAAIKAFTALNSEDEI